MKWSFSKLDVGRSSNRALPLATYSPSFNRFATCSVIFDFFFRVSDTSFLRTLCFASLLVGNGSFSCKWHSNERCMLRTPPTSTCHKRHRGHVSVRFYRIIASLHKHKLHAWGTQICGAVDGTSNGCDANMSAECIRYSVMHRWHSSFIIPMDPISPFWR